MHRTHRLLLPLLLAAAVTVLPSAGALAAWQVVTPSGGGSSWYQYPTAGATGGGTGTTGGTTTGTSGGAGSTGSGGTGTTGSGGTGATGSGSTGSTGGTGGGTTTTTTGTTCIGDGWYQTCTTTAGSGSGTTGTTSGSTGATGGSGSTGSGTGTTGSSGGSTGATGGTTAGGITLTADEQQLFNTVNQLRASHGLGPLALNATLVQLAREKSQDMITNNYFGHTSPDLGTPLQMQQNAGLSCQVMGGENIAAAANISLAIFMFETSSPHMANILYPTYTVTGVGVVADGPYGVYVTEEFAGGC